MREIKIGDKITIGNNHKPMIIAEMSGNHNKSLEKAIKMVEAAAMSGAHAIKLQTFTPDTITINFSGGFFDIKDNNSLWNGRNLYELYGEAYTPWEWHQPLFKRAKELGLLAFSTPFDESAVDFLEDLGVSAYKVASFENTHWPLLRKIAKTNKPIILSTGASTLTNIDETSRLLRTSGVEDLILLKCTSTYPASPENTNLLTIPHLSEMFNCHVGLSDHTLGIGVAIAAIALGARVIEKHFTLSRAEYSVDSAFSIEPEELKNLVTESERAFLGMGRVRYGISESEKNSLCFKRSIYIVKDILPGECFSQENTRIIRPGNGLEPKFQDLIIGKKANRKLDQGTPMSWDFIG